jgi:hypothetical protein
LFKAAASRPHSKGFASNHAALIEMQLCVPGQPSQSSSLGAL